MIQMYVTLAPGSEFPKSLMPLLTVNDDMLHISNILGFRTDQSGSALVVVTKHGKITYTSYYAEYKNF